MAAGAGGSIPLVASLHEAAPSAAILLGGTTDGYSNIHGPNERVLLDEFRRTTVAIADLFVRQGDLDKAVADLVESQRAKGSDKASLLSHRTPRPSRLDISITDRVASLGSDAAK